MNIALNRRRLTILILVAALVLCAVSAVIWWNYVYQSPSRVFWGMLGNNLQTSSVTKHQHTASTGQSGDQYVRLQFGGTTASKWLVSLKQAQSSVVTESIGTPTTGYVRYVSLSTTQKHADGSAYNFDSVRNIWAAADPGNTGALGQLFSQSVLDVGTAPLPPIGNLTAENRQNLLDFMRTQNIFTPDYASMKRETRDGRRVYVYNVSVSLLPYLRMMQAFAHDNGLKDLDSVDASQFQSAAPVKLVFVVDTVSHQLREVSYAGANFSQTYSDYGLATPITIPAKTIPIKELQDRLQKL